MSTEDFLKIKPFENFLLYGIAIFCCHPSCLWHAIIHLVHCYDYERKNTGFKPYCVFVYLFRNVCAGEGCVSVCLLVHVCIVLCISLFVY